MKIWMLSHTYFPAIGGIENYLREVGKVLLKKGHQPIVICRRHLPELSEEETIDGVPVIRHPDFPVPKSKLFSKPLYLAKRIGAWLKKSPYCREGRALCRYPHYQFALSSLDNRCRSIYLPASVWPVLAPLMASSGSIKERFFELCWRRQISFLERESLKRASRVMFFSRNMQDQIKEIYGVDPGLTVVNPPGVDSDRFRPVPPDPELFRSLKLTPGIPRVLSLSRLSPEKNLVFLLRSLKPLLKAKRAILLLVGSGPLKGLLEKEIYKLELGGSVRLIDSRKQPETIYHLADIFISVSRYESFGQSILEAMASGLPVIALRSAPPGIRVAAEEIIAEGLSGYTIPDNETALQAKIDDLVSSDRLRKEMGEKGRKICRERFAWEGHVSRLLKEFEATEMKKS